MRDAIANENVNASILYDFYRNLENAITRLKKNKQAGDVDKINAFLLDMTQMEQDSGAARQLDKTLCITFDGYEISVQRLRFIQRVLDSSKDEAMPDLGLPRHAEILAYRQQQKSERIEHFNEIMAELNKIPEEIRTDLSTQLP